jgi:hypothetical protein
MHMLGFRMSKGPAPRKDLIDDILARHKANLAAERKPVTRNDPPTVSRKIPGFGRRAASS